MATAKRPTPAVTELLRAVEGGDMAARDELISAVYQEMRRLARRILSGDRARQVLAPTELVHGAALKLLGQEVVSARDRAHFLAYSGQVMRQVLIDHVRREASAKRDGGTRVTLVSSIAEEPSSDVDVEALHEVLDQLAVVSPEHAKLVEMRYFGGMTIEEIAAVLGSSSATVKRQWRVARTWLHNALAPPG
ncbi:MAG: sigma-70 family RNA polymerase sigma factor [Ideonella sp.]|nr:sigma-70 family RNA polymerase sigma factor [Ideonella sp.]